MQDVIINNYLYILSRLSRGYREPLGVLLDQISLNQELPDYDLLYSQLIDYDLSKLQL